MIFLVGNSLCKNLFFKKVKHRTLKALVRFFTHGSRVRFLFDQFLLYKNVFFWEGKGENCPTPFPLKNEEINCPTPFPLKNEEINEEISSLLFQYFKRWRTYLRLQVPNWGWEADMFVCLKALPKIPQLILDSSLEIFQRRYICEIKFYLWAKCTIVRCKIFVYGLCKNIHSVTSLYLPFSLFVWDTFCM